MNRIQIYVLIGLLAWIGLDSFYVIDEGQLAIVTRFGEYRGSRLSPGPYFKVPFSDSVTKMEKRILGSDTPQAEYLTLDKKKLVADPVTRWRIDKPLEFYKSVGSITAAKARIDDIVTSELRDEFASHNFGDIIGVSRQPMMERVAERARANVKEFGVYLVDVQIKRADLPREVEESVFQRMRAERDRMAKRYRSEGDEESAKIKAETDKEKAILLAQAYEKAQSLIGEGDAKGVSIYADAFGKDPEFYAFSRSLEAYEIAIDPTTHLVLSTNNELFRYVGAPR